MLPPDYRGFAFGEQKNGMGTDFNALFITVAGLVVQFE
jgi:hypothetical protein